MFCSDLDGTLVGTRAWTEQFRDAWQQNAPRPLLVYSSGRLIEDIRALMKTEPLPRPDFIIGGVGTMMFDVSADALVQPFMQRMTDGWDVTTAETIMRQISGATRQPDKFLHERKSSWYLHDATPDLLAEISDRLKEAGLKARVVYSSNRDLDILPEGSDKGAALDWLCQHLGIAPEETIVAGDTGNDAGMFLVPGVRGILVANALPELIDATASAETYKSPQENAQGVIDGLRHYGALV